MKVLLVYPNFRDREAYPPLGIAYLASVLKKNNIEFAILDTTFTQNWKDFRKEVKKQHPTIVGFSYPSSYAVHALRGATIVKSLFPKTKVVMGGPHPTIFPEETVLNGNIDFVVIGEGEVTFIELIRALERKSELKDIKGICYKENEKASVIESRDYIKDLNSLPFPAWQSFPTLPQYFRYSGSGISLMGSRGCPFRCSFCQPTLQKIFGSKVRFRSSESVIEEIKYLKSLGIKKLVFQDDILTLRKVWIEKLCDLMIEEAVNTTWFCNSRVEIITAELLEKMKNAGLGKVALGVESGSQRILDEVLQKGIKISDTINAFRLCREAKIKTTAFTMLGSPTESCKELNETIALIKKIKPDWISVTRVVLLPKTHLWNFAKKTNTRLVEENDFTQFHYADFSSKTHKLNMTDKELHKGKNRLFLTWAVTTVRKEPIKKMAVIFFALLSTYFPRISRFLGKTLSHFIWVPPPIYS